MNRKNVTAVTAICIALMSVLLMMSPPKAWAGEKVGIITDLKGSVTVNGKNAELLQEVETNSILAGKAGSKMTVSFRKDGHTESISGDFSVKVDKKMLINTKGNKVSKKDTIKKRTDGMTAIPITVTKPAALRLRGLGILPLSPVHRTTIKDKKDDKDDKDILNTVDTVTPSFRFVASPTNSDPEKMKYVIIRNITDSNDRRVIDITKKDKKIITVEYPKDMPPLKNCKEYRWLVSDKDKEEIDANEFFKFTVLSAETIDALKTQEELARKLVKKNPDDLFPYVSLISLYLSNKAFSKALEYAKLIEQMRPKDNNIVALIDTIYFEIYGEANMKSIKAQIQRIQ